MKSQKTKKMARRHYPKVIVIDNVETIQDKFDYMDGYFDDISTVCYIKDWPRAGFNMCEMQL